MSVTSFVLVVSPPERHVLTAERVIKVHNKNPIEIIWLSIIKTGSIKLLIKGEKVVLNKKQLQTFVNKNLISAFYIDNYFNKENVLLISYLYDLPLYVINYGVYHCIDEYNYTFAKYYKLTLPLLYLTKLKLFLRDFYLFYFTKKKLDIRKYIYQKAIVLFWNEYSRLNFIRDYPYSKTRLIQITDVNNTYQGSNFKILVAPSILGGRHGKSGREELNLWILYLKKIHVSFPDSAIHISLHPLYKGAHFKDFINLEFVTQIYTGIPSETVKEYSCVFTDTSTLFWIAESYGVTAYFLDGYKIPKKYFNGELLDRSKYFLNIFFIYLLILFY